MNFFVCFLLKHKRPYELILFFQAEDGIRGLYVTGVQTCALPICCGSDPARACRYRVRPGVGLGSSSGSGMLIGQRAGGAVAVTDEAIEKLRDMIVSGRLKPGDRLPREADLATSLGLSRSSLREAVRALSLVRILDVRQGDGTYVSSLAADSLLDALSFIVEFHHDASVLELLEVRRILEPAASARAAVLIDDASLASLEEILD